MKKMFVWILAVCLLMLSISAVLAEEDSTTGDKKTNSTGFPSFADGFPELEPIDTSTWGTFETPDMGTLPEMPEFDTSAWDDFKAPEGWGDLSLDGFSMPVQGDGWGSLGTGSDWGSAFEEMKKSMESGFSSSFGQGDTSDWPPASFKEMQEAFNQQKSDIGSNNGSDMPNVKDLFSEKFGDVGTVDTEGGIPSLDFASDALQQSIGSLNMPESALISAMSSVANLNKINDFLNGISSRISETPTINNEFPSLSGEIEHVDMKSVYESLSSSLTPVLDENKKYGGSLFGSN